MEDSEKNELNSDEIINKENNSAVDVAEEVSASEDENIEDAVIIESEKAESDGSSQISESTSVESEDSALISDDATAIEKDSSEEISEEIADAEQEKSDEVSDEATETEQEDTEFVQEKASDTKNDDSVQASEEVADSEINDGDKEPDNQPAKVELELSVQASESEIANEIREIIAEETKSIEITKEDSSSSETQNSKPAAVLEELDRLKAESKEKAEDATSEGKEASESNEEQEVVANTDSQAKDESEQASVDDSAKQEEQVSSDETKVYHSKKRIFTKEFWKSFIFDLVFLAICAFFIVAMAQKWFASHQTVIEGTNNGVVSLESGNKNTVGNINILMMGIDSVEGTHRSDTIFVLGVNPSKKKVTMLSIPRDTRVIIENKSRKINEILPRYGEPTLRKILEDLLKIKINKKAEVGFESFISVIDAIGGVDINIEKAMNYDDNWGNLHIHFKPGMNHLNGQQALNYVRFRKDAMADLGRIKRQQDFVKAVIKKLISPTVIVRLPSIIENVFQYVKTDFTLPEILTIVNGFDNFDIKLKTLSLPGEARYIDKVSYFLPYQDEAIAIGDSYFEDMAIFEIEKNFESKKIIPIDIPNRKKNK